MIRYAQTSDEPTLLSLLPVYRSVLLDVNYPRGAMIDTDAGSLAGALALRYQDLSEDLRAAVIAIIPSAALRPSLAPLDRVIAQETDAAC